MNKFRRGDLVEVICDGYQTVQKIHENISDVHLHIVNNLDPNEPGRYFPSWDTEDESYRIISFDYPTVEILQEGAYKLSNSRAFALFERYVTKQSMTGQLARYGCNTVIFAHSKIVSLGNIIREHRF